MGIDADGLAQTIERFNGFARTGVDEDFHRGESAYDKYYSDPTNKPNPSLGELTHPPYYAVKMVPATWAPRVVCAPMCIPARCVTTAL